MSHKASLTPRCLVINSYHPNYVWTDLQTRGILGVLVKSNVPLQDVALEYLDAKRIPNIVHSNAFINLLKAKYELAALKCVIVTDNNALDFCLQHRETLFPGIPLVFCGINGYTPELIKDHRQVTGVPETVKIEETLRLAFKLHPQANNLVVIHDQTVTGTHFRREFDQEWEKMNRPMPCEILTDLTFNELEAKLASLSSNTIALLLSFAVDRAGKVVEQSEEARMISSYCRIPIYALHQQRLGYGIVGGMQLQGELHGAQAGKMVAEILAGKKVDEIPITSVNDCPPVFDYVQLERWNIPLTKLPADATIINQPASIWKDYRGYVTAGILVVAGLSSIIVLLVLVIVNRRRYEASQKKSRERLDAALDQLRHSESKYRSIYEGAVEGICQVAYGGQILTANPALARILGYESPTDLIQSVSSNALTIWKTPQERERFLQVLKEKGSLHGYECEFRHKSGNTIWVSMASRLVVNPDGTPLHIESFIQDISADKQNELTRATLENQLRQSQKMEAVGRLAGGVAHDFNNMLNVIMGYAELIESQLTPSSPYYEGIQEISKASRRSADLTRQLLAFSRKQTIAPKVLDLNRQLNEMERMLKRILHENVKLEFKLAPDLWPVLIDPSQIDQIIANLVVNARDAMPNGGTLSIESRNVIFSEDISDTQGEFRMGDFVFLCVTDSGCGMDGNTLEHIFEPFYTTKGEGRGTGLGMATVYGIVKQNNGFISIYSELGHGAAIKIYLPRYIGDMSQQSSSPLPVDDAAMPRGQETILLVEDHDQLRKMAERMLKSLGYTVIAASGPEEAIQICREYKASIDLMLTDVIMPGMNARKLAALISDIRKNIKIVYTSGYTADTMTHQGVLEEGIHFIPKPFSKSDLSEKLQSVLNPKTARTNGKRHQSPR